MTDIPHPDPDDATAADPADVDLEQYKSSRWGPSPKLIAAIEALRERVAEEQELKKGYYDEAAIGWARARAAEARGAELEGVVQDLLKEIKEALIGLFGDNPDDPFENQSVIKYARTILAATPAEALERARAVEELIDATRQCRDGSVQDCGGSIYPDCTTVHLPLKAWNAQGSAMIKLYTLTKGDATTNETE